MMAALMQTVDDTTTLHRGGIAGLARIRRDGQALARLVDEERDCTAFLTRLNDDYKRLNLTLGGVADMLGLAFGWLIFNGEIAPDAHSAKQILTIRAGFKNPPPET
jgi:triphosphoribosyl-dephospho-CoA synthase